MIYELRYRIDVPSSQKAVALRDALAEQLTADEDVVLEAADSTQVLETFTVYAVDTASKEPKAVEVEAASYEEAKAEVESDDVVVVDSSDVAG